MNKEIFNVVVTVMGALMSLAHFPQAYKIYTTKRAKDISLITYSIFFIGSIIWLIYGILIRELPVIITFVIAVIGTASVLLLTLKFR